jgi:hypothetical protein
MPSHKPESTKNNTTQFLFTPSITEKLLRDKEDWPHKFYKIGQIMKI